MPPHVIYTSWHTLMTYSFIKHQLHSCVEIVTPEQEEGESDPVGDDASFETQGRHLSILLSYILDQ